MVVRKRPAASQLGRYYGAKRFRTVNWKLRAGWEIARRAPSAIRLISRIARRRRRAYRRQQRRSYAGRSGPSSKRTSQVRGSFNPSVTAYFQSVYQSWYGEPLDEIDRGTGIRERLSGRNFIKGFKICGRIINPNPYPAEFHWAVVQDKEPNQVDLKTRLFRSTANTANRYLTPVDFATTPGWNIQYLCNSINSNRFNVITHKKHTIGGQGTYPLSASQNALGQSYWMKRIDEYIPIKRSVSYQDSSATTAIEPWYLVWWWLPPDDSHFNPGSADFCKTLWKTEMYYSDGRA